MKIEINSAVVVLLKSLYLNVAARITTLAVAAEKKKSRLMMMRNYLKSLLLNLIIAVAVSSPLLFAPSLTPLIL